MKNFFKKLMAKIILWLTAPSCQAQTYTCCRDAEEDGEKQEKEPEQKPGGFIY